MSYFLTVSNLENCRVTRGLEFFLYNIIIFGPQYCNNNTNKKLLIMFACKVLNGNYNFLRTTQNVKKIT